MTAPPFPLALDTAELRPVAAACAAAASGIPLATTPETVDPHTVQALVGRHRLSPAVVRMLAAARLVGRDRSGQVAKPLAAAAQAGVDRVFTAMLRLADNVVGVRAAKPGVAGGGRRAALGDALPMAAIVLVSHRGEALAGGRVGARAGTT